MKDDMLKYSMDAASALIAVGSITSLLPPLAAMLTIVWTGIRIFESPTIQSWLGRQAPSKRDDE